MEPIFLEIRISDESDVIITLGRLLDAAVKLGDCDMVAYLQVAHALLTKRAMQR